MLGPEECAREIRVEGVSPAGGRDVRQRGQFANGASIIQRDVEAPNRSVAVVTSVRASVSSRMSPTNALAWPPLDSMSRTSDSSSASRRAVTTTCAPSLANGSAAARPMPELRAGDDCDFTC